MSHPQAYSSDSDQAFDGETLSPTGMQVDGDEYVVEPPESENDDVAIINPDDDGEQLVALPTADNCMSSVFSNKWVAILNHSL
jgi:sugar lactone lactonase YvrE